MSTSQAEFYATLLDPMYDEWGVAARIIPGAGIAPIDVTAIDKTDGVAINEGNGFQLETIKPVVCVRLAELAENGASIRTISDGQVVLDRGTPAEKVWRIKAPRQQGGELLLILLDEVLQ